MDNSKYLRLTESGECQLVEEKISKLNPSSALQQYVQTQGFLTPGLGAGTYVYFCSLGIIPIKVMEEVPFKTAMVLVNAAGEDGEEKPVFMPNFRIGAHGAISSEEPFKLVPPEDMRLIFLCSPGLGKCYFVAQDKRTGELWHPLVTNTYSDGAICMGGAQTPAFNANEGIAAYLDQYAKSWGDAGWNNDLSEHSGNFIDEWLQFDPKTKKNILPKDRHWTEMSAGKISLTEDLNNALAMLHEGLGGNRE